MATKLPRRFYWHARSTNGGTLSLEVNVREALSKNEKVRAIADGLRASVKFMEKQGFIPLHARLMSSRDLSDEYGKTRQYWEKLLNEGRILFKETSAGRITTDLWVEGYRGKREEVNKYVKDVKTVLEQISRRRKRNGVMLCPICGDEKFSFNVNMDGNTNGICRNPTCGFHVYTTSDDS